MSNQDQFRGIHPRPGSSATNALTGEEVNFGRLTTVLDSTAWKDLVALPGIEPGSPTQIQQLSGANDTLDNARPRMIWSMMSHLDLNF
ncbi:MAG: hypothetical protein ACXVZI_04050, partial [Terriglobales bacterium]